MTKSKDRAEPQHLDLQTRLPQNIAGVRRRMGFVALLWWIAAGAGTIGLLQGLRAGWVRLVLIGIAWVMASFFSYAWWQIHKGSSPK